MNFAAYLNNSLSTFTIIFTVTEDEFKLFFTTVYENWKNYFKASKMLLWHLLSLSKWSHICQLLGIYHSHIASSGTYFFSKYASRKCKCITILDKAFTWIDSKKWGLTFSILNFKGSKCRLKVTLQQKDW